MKGKNMKNNNSYERLNCIQASFSELSKNDMEIKSADDFDLFRRLNEIDGELQHFHISAYQCDLLSVCNIAGSKQINVVYSSTSQISLWGFLLTMISSTNNISFFYML